MIFQKYWRSISMLFLKTLIAVLLGAVGAKTVHAQGYIEHSQSIGAAGPDGFSKSVTANGYTYIIGYGNVGNRTGLLPGSYAPGARTAILYKLDGNGTVVWSRYIPSNGQPLLYSIILESNGIIHMASGTDISGITTTDGSTISGSYDVVYTRVDANNGSLLFHGYLGGSQDDRVGLDMAVDGSHTYITFGTASPGLRTTNGSVFTSGYDRYVMEFDGNMNVVYATYLGNVNNSSTQVHNISLKIFNQKAYLAFNIGATATITSTNGTSKVGGVDVAVVRLDGYGNKEFSTIIGGTLNDLDPQITVVNEEIYLTAATISADYPVTDGSKLRTGTLPYHAVLTKLSSTGNIIYSKYLVGTNQNTLRTDFTLEVENGFLYIAGKMASNPSLYFATTDGSTGHDFLLKLNAATGSVIYSKSVGGIGTTINGGRHYMTLTNDAIFIAMSSNNIQTARTTDGTTHKQFGVYLAKLSKTDGSLQYGTFLNGQYDSGINFDMAVSGSDVFISAHNTMIENLPVTKPSILANDSYDLFFTKYSFCPPSATPNTISPLTQIICKQGVTSPIIGSKSSFSSDNLPIVYYNGVPTPQQEIKARYQWQVADAAAGSWVNAGGISTQQDFAPPASSTDKYYRRLVLAPVGCTPELISTSDVSAVLVTADNAPEITSVIANTCVGTPVEISVTTTGGTAPYTYNWLNGVSSATNTATVTPSANSVYTVNVTDQNGCLQVGQVVVNAYKADAGAPTVSVCAGQPVRLGTPPPAGLPGVVYTWTPVEGLSDPNIAQPFANPATPTTYTLTVTLPMTGGGTCATTDNVDVILVTAPTNPSFAGTDQVLCKGSTTVLGMAETGFTYNWTPGSYLSASNIATPTFNAGSYLPETNPVVYTVTAQKDGCTFTDQVTVAMLDPRAGDEYCGPRTVGKDDLTPGLAGKTFLWEVVSGPGTITGATNTLKTTVAASVGGTTLYRLTETYNGFSCSSTVTVPECSGGGLTCPNADIKVEASHGCASTLLGAVTLRALPATISEDTWNISWTSSTGAGISATTGMSITLTDNVEKTVTLTITHKDNPSISCSKTIPVNDPLWSLPDFPVADQSICKGASVAIGLPSVAGYEYLWTDLKGPGQTNSNPTVSPAATTTYQIEVTDNLNGCKTIKDVEVSVTAPVNNPGSGWTVCNTTMITLGSTAIAGNSYSWTPASANYVQSTDETSAQPKVVVSISQDFTLRVTDRATGCYVDSTIQIVVDPSNTLPAMNDTTICLNGEGAQIGNLDWSGVSYSWFPANGLSDPTVARPIANPTATTTYTLTVQYYDENGDPTCTKQGAITVNVSNPTITMADENICPSGPIYNLGTGVTTTDATLFNWSPAYIVDNPNTLASPVKFNPSVPTTYTLIASDIHGCADTASRIISPTAVSAKAGGNSSVCLGTSITLGHSDNTGTITWTVLPVVTGTFVGLNDATPTFTPALGDAGKWFTFIITQDNGGCISIDSAKVMVGGFELPAIATQMVCNNSSTTIGIAATSGYQYQWYPADGLSSPTSATTVANNLTDTRTYTLVATDQFGCISTTDATIGVNPVTAPSISIPTNNAIYGAPAPAFAPIVTGTSSPYSFMWTPLTGVDNPYISNATPYYTSIGSSNYMLSVTDANGCTSQVEASLLTSQLVLPIKLSYLNSAVTSCNAVLRWGIESSEHFSHFIVERGINGTNFKAVAQVPFNLIMTSYVYEDVNPGTGKWNYRLKMIDMDGKWSYSPITTAPINCASPLSQSVYPNPFRNNISIKSSITIQKVLLYSISGSVLAEYVYNQTQVGTITLQLPANMAQGMYIVQTFATDGTVQNTKIIKD